MTVGRQAQSGFLHECHLYTAPSNNMQRQFYRDRGRRVASLIGGLVLVESGVLQFLKLQFGFDWPQMWPLFLAIPGLTWTLSTLFDISKSTKE